MELHGTRVGQRSQQGLLQDFQFPQLKAKGSTGPEASAVQYPGQKHEPLLRDIKLTFVACVAPARKAESAE